MYQNQKSNGKKWYTRYYGSYFGATLTFITFGIAFNYLIIKIIYMSSGRNDYLDVKSVPNYFNDEFGEFNIGNSSEVFEPQFVIKAFSYKYYEQGFNVSLGEELSSKSGFLHVNVSKLH